MNYILSVVFQINILHFLKCQWKFSPHFINLLVQFPLSVGTNLKREVLFCCIHYSGTNVITALCSDVITRSDIVEHTGESNHDVSGPNYLILQSRQALSDKSS